MNDLDHAPAGRPAELLRRAGDVDDAPPPQVWEALARALREDGRHTSEAPASLHRARSRREARRGGGARGGGLRLVAAAAAGALLTWAGIALAEREPAQVVASGDLAVLAEGGAEGRAEVVQVDGQSRLRVELEDVPDAGDGYLEVWLLRPDVSGMVTLGVLDGQTAEFPLPEGLDLVEYAVVDISREHVDGDPGHGGDSLVRGEVG
ncbi:anti-sigma factor [Ornithinimicrobium pekingense]|uniref:Anti-sigma K factor RskA C-terminal domain-containing protein n=1 Tax=Ornithinimicrobium pekingense TaxID=384677 RepID=A0ABQ2F400_9MICO|nr:anti-sigma factor [Ornithinimicrobium pekingense]GGK56291.1 hypothetical protein GCM10011509_00850 [Ornithinimicrobium pekingense]